MESKHSGTRLCRARETVVHGDICTGAPRVCGSRNGNRSSSILAVAFEDRYTPPVSRHRWRSTVRRRRRRRWLVDPCFTFRTNRGGATLRSVRSLSLSGNCALLGLRWMSNVGSSIMSILQIAITAVLNGTFACLMSVRTGFSPD